MLNHLQQSAVLSRLSKSWLYKWITRYKARSPDWYCEQSRRPHRSPGRTDTRIEHAVLNLRQTLDAQGLFCGAQNILWELEQRDYEHLPSLRTINRILERHGLVRKSPGRYEAKGKRYPTLAGIRVNNVHQTDFLGPCYITGPLRFYSINTVDVATGRCGIEPVLARDAQRVINAIWHIWRRLGIPRHQQVDNEMVFYGSPTHPRGMGCLIRLCLLYDVEPWFIPMAEPWRNGVVEKFNDHYRQKFLRRVTIKGPQDLIRQSQRFEDRHNQLYRYSKLAGRTPLQALAESKIKLRFPLEQQAPQHPLPKPERGRYHLVRFIRSDQILDIFGERFRLPREAVYEYVTATIDVQSQTLMISLDNNQIDEIKYKLR